MFVFWGYCVVVSYLSSRSSIEKLSMYICSMTILYPLMKNVTMLYMSGVVA